MNKEYLEEIINTFILKNRRSRFLDLLKSKKRYDDFLDNLLRDPRYFDPKCIIETSGNNQTPEIIYGELKKLGANNQCFVVSSDIEEDGLLVDLKAYLQKIVGSMSETLVYCPERRIGYFEGHEGWRYILSSPTYK